MIEHGFDSTDFGNAYRWRRIMEACQLYERDRLEMAFRWTNESGLEVVTQNNPLTGVYGPGNRKDEEGFASYIGATGPIDEVYKFADLVKLHAYSIKDESPGRRSYI